MELNSYSTYIDMVDACRKEFSSGRVYFHQSWEFSGSESVLMALYQKAEAPILVIATSPGKLRNKQ